VTSLTAVSGPRPSRPDGGRQRHGGRPAAAGPQHREGRPGESFLPREECAQRAQGKKVADRPLRDRGRRATASASRRLIRQQQAAKERWSLSRQGEAWFRRLRLRDDRLTHPPARSQRRKACSARVIEREDRTGGGPPATLKCRAAADPKSIRCWFDPAEVLQFIRQRWAQLGLVIDPVFGALHRQCAHACGLALFGHGIFAERPSICSSSSP
jgi:hypothetical protein